MPELLDATQNAPILQDMVVLEGTVVEIRGEKFLSVEGSTALVGPLVGAEDVADKTDGVAVVSQRGTPFVVRPVTGSQDGGTGEQGPPGPQGPAGPPGGVSFRKVIGDGTSKAFTVQHNIGTKDVQVMLYRTAAPYDEMFAEVEHTDANTVTIRTITTLGPGEVTVVCSGPGSATGAGSGDLNYVHTQVSAASQWDVTHNLGKWPAVEVVDSGGSSLLPDVVFLTVNTLRLNFAGATSGKAFVN